MFSNEVMSILIYQACLIIAAIIPLTQIKIPYTARVWSVCTLVGMKAMDLSLRYADPNLESTLLGETTFLHLLAYILDFLAIGLLYPWIAKQVHCNNIHKFIPNEELRV